MEPERDPEGQESEFLYQIGQLAKARVLEIGCGNGRVTRRYAAQPAMIAGLDLEWEALVTAVADRPSTLAKKVTFLSADAEALPFANESFDVAILAWSL